jgi:hypothetical protein
MTAALELARDTAKRGVPLTVDALVEFQGVVLGHCVELRTGDAFAKGGRERYSILPDLRERLEMCLADASNEAPTPVRAARAYLDVCFFHPFDDGNARAARVALDYVLTAAGLGLHAAEPLFMLARAAGDATGAVSFANAIQWLTGPLANP